MANYLTSFNTYADYSGATLDLPNVSLVKNEGKVYYNNIFAGAVLGDILMYDVANDKLVCTFGAEWNTTLYPLADYEPIAINIYPASQTPDNKARFMALKWASNESASGSTSSVRLVWGLAGSTCGQYTSCNSSELNGKSDTNRALTFADGTSANTQEAFAAFYAANQFCTNGTSAGDWYVPSMHELDLYQANYATINGLITNIKNASSSIVFTVNDNMWTSSENSYDGSALLTISGRLDTNYVRSANYVAVRGVISL